MAHPWIHHVRRWAAGAFAVLAVTALSGLPAHSNSIIMTRGVTEKSTHRALVQNLGGVQPGLRHQFTVVLKVRTAAAADAVAAYFRRFGMAAAISRGYRSVHVSGTFGSAAAAAGVRFERVRMGNETYIRTNAAPSFPPGIGRLVAATSISPGMKMRSLLIRPRPQATIWGPQTGYGPADYAGIYDISPLYGVGINGSGETVDVAACFNIDPNDVAFFETFYGLPPNTVHVIHVDGTLDMSGNVPPPDIEPTLDVERIIATAPGAKVNLYLVPDCLVSQFVDMFDQIADDGHSDSLSVSYGLPEADYAVGGFGFLIAAQQATLQDVADAHIQTFAASGDSGSWGDPFIAINFTDVLYPASDPNVLSVGGTTTEENIIGGRLFEYAWSGSGGGYSGIFPIPPWQAATPGVASGLFKNIPDIALNADPETGAAEAFLVSFPPPIFAVGGTSASSPTWAAFIALVDQNRVAHGHKRLGGNAEPAIYSLRGSSAYYDITVGANGFFPARKGYDNVTGLGVPDVAKLVKALQ